jgi:hypothetical protein
MSGKNQGIINFNFQSTNPITGFLPNPYPGGSKPSGTVAGTMASTNTIYSNIVDVSRMDNVGLEVAWSGNPTGTFSILVSNSGINFNSLTFSPVLAQPAGSAGGMAVDLNQLPFKYIVLQYVNSSGTGSLTVYGEQKDLN